MQTHFKKAFWNCAWKPSKQDMICLKGFGLKTNLKIHFQTVHKNVKPFSCNICLKTFGQRSGLSQHKKAGHEKKTD